MSNELVNYEEKTFAVGPSSVSDFFSGNSVGKIWTSIPLDGSRDSRIRLLNSIENVKAGLRDVLGQVIQVENVVCHSVVLQTETGEEVEAVRTVLIDDQGDCYASVSDGVRASLARIFAVVGVPPWNPPIKITPREVKTRKGFRVLKLELVV